MKRVELAEVRENRSRAMNVRDNPPQRYSSTGKPLITKDGEFEVDLTVALAASDQERKVDDMEMNLPGAVPAEAVYSCIDVARCQ